MMIYSETMNLKVNDWINNNHTKYENYIIKKLKKAEIPYCIVRIFNIADKKQPKNFFYKSSLVKIKEKKNKTIKFENLNHFRDFIAIEDIAKIILYFLKKKITGVINLSTGRPTNLGSIARLISKKYKKKIKIFDNNRHSFLVGNNSLLRRIYKKKLIISLNKMIFKK